MNRRDFLKVAGGATATTLADRREAFAQSYPATLVISFSQTRQWFYSDTFKRYAPDWLTAWGLRYHQSSSGLWMDPAFEGWNPEYLSKDVGDPAQVVFPIASLTYETDPAFWDDRIARSVVTIREKLPTTQLIYLQPCIGGTAHTDTCAGNRSATNHLHAEAAISRAVTFDPGLRVGGGACHVVRCGHFSDVHGHLTLNGKNNQGKRIGSWYGANR